jgi:dephospho-CoA kinase
MKVIGLTGGIGSGKSTVGGYLAEMGAAIIELDKVGHEVMKSGSKTFKEVVSEFGKDILNDRGEIDRARLARIVFHNRQALGRLNRIVHPAIDKIINKRIEEYRRRGIKVVVLEAAAILEAGRARQADEIWVTTAPEATVLKRLGTRSGYSKEEAEARIRAQISDEERIKHADVVIDNEGSLDEVKARVQEEWARLLERNGEQWRRGWDSNPR